ncbi:MAG: phosphate/phosphite/phosphonate ABC transporter substrate-binding protein [Nitrospirae bacterium]|nr:phosphate/phosphite/phosphonate ABC transporter substrate-binding protein [Nitrospirota bacterium]
MAWRRDRQGHAVKYVSVLIILAAFLTAVPLLSSSEPPQKEILIGLIPEMNVFKQMERFHPLAEYLTKKTGVKVNIKILSRYGNIIDSFFSEMLDGAFFGSFTGALAIEKLGVEPLARPVNLDGSSTYHGYIFARKDGGIKTVRDMKGRKMAFVDKATTAGYIFPIAYLRQNGVNDIRQIFSEHYFTGSHDAAIHAVLDRKADIGAAKNTVYDLMSKTDPRLGKELVIIAESAKVPQNGLCIRKGLDKTLKKNLKDALLNLDKDPQGKKVLERFGAIRFIETTVSDYKPVFDMANRAGIDIRRYDYRNE